MDFGREIKEVWEDIQKFYRQEKALRWFAAAVLFLLYGIRLAYGDYFIDSEVMLDDADGLMWLWYGHGRFGLVLTKKLFFMARLTPYLENAMFALMFWLTAMTAVFCIWYWSGKRRTGIGSFLFVLMFLSAPCYVEQFNFLLQAFEIAFAMWLCIAAAFCVGKWIHEKRSACWMIPGFLFLIWAFGSYQPMVAFYIAWVLIMYQTVYRRADKPCAWREGILHAAVFLAGFAAEQLIAAAVCKWQGADSFYVDGMFRWGRDSLQTCLANIRMDADRIYRGSWAIFFQSRTFNLVMAVSCFGAMLDGWRKNKRNILCLAIAWGLLILSPMLVTFATATIQPVRGQLVFPVVYAYGVFGCYECVCRLSEWIWRKRTGAEHLKRAVRAVCLIAGIGLGWSQCAIVSQLWETAHESSVNDRSRANRIYAEICRKAGTGYMEDCTVVFVGARNVEIGGYPVYGDVIGHSFFQWGAHEELGVNTRVHAYFKSLGFKMGMPDQEQFEEAKKACEGRTMWPAEESIFLLRDGLMVVKLSDPV